MVDLLVIGATGYTGKFIVEYLHNHPERSSFTFGIAARSRSKLNALVDELHLNASVKTFVVDTLKQAEVEEVVSQAKVVISAIGPFWLYGSGIVGACVRQGKHYVDITGETHWIRDMVFQYDFYATRTHSIIIPSSGFDSVPSDLAVYLSSKTIKAAAGEDAQLENSISAFDFPIAASGGTIHSAIAVIEQVPRYKMKLGMADFALSTAIRGVASHRPKLLYQLPFSTTVGNFFPMMFPNRAIVQRTWGLFEYTLKQAFHTPSQQERALAYGPRFKYEEFAVKKSSIIALIAGIVVTSTMFLMLFPPFRWFLKMVVPASGYGPSEANQRKGHCKITNITSSVPTPSKRIVHVRTTIDYKGGPYLFTALTASESALSLLLSHSELTPFAKQGGVLTPMSALGDVLVKRLVKSGVSLRSEVIQKGGRV